MCSGIEAASCAWHPLGWRPVFNSEIEDFPSAVLAHRWPGVLNLGDFTKIGTDHAIELLVGGTPCQSFSLAGLRGGLTDERGNLALEFLRLAQRLRPRWLVWENVPGVISSWTDAEACADGSRWQSNDFDTFLSGLSECGYGWAWRVLDAQYFGVPQRRRRVFLVAHLGSWQRAATVLFDAHSLSGNVAPRREKGQDVAGTLTASLGRRRGGGIEPGHITCTPDGIAGTVTSKWSKGCGGPAGDEHYNLIIAPYSVRTANTGANGHGFAEDIAHTVDCAQGQALLLSMPQPRARRYTPRECERLQGFPDDYTLVPWKNKMAPDALRYKAIGNSMAVPVMRWLGERIQLVEDAQ